MATKYLTEILSEINEDPKKIEQWKNYAPLKVLLEYAFIPEKKFILPETEPPYKPDAAPIGMSETNLVMELRRFYVFLREDLSPLKREQLFINLLEGVHPEEAKLLLAVKDQKISKLYKKVTRKLVESVGLIPPLPKGESKKEDNGTGSA